MAPLAAFAYLLFVANFHFVMPFCNNTLTKNPLEFKSSPSGTTIPVMIVDGIGLELECCVWSTSPSVNWTVNDNIASYYGDSLKLSEENQVLNVVINPVSGTYRCTASDGIRSIYKTFLVERLSWDPKCSLGYYGEVRQDYPPKDIYNVQPYSTVKLKCIGIIYCGSKLDVSTVQWLKTDSDLEPFRIYRLYVDSQYDRVTGDSVNITYSIVKGNATAVIVESTLTIANVSYDDLQYDNGTDYGSCAPDANGSCIRRNTYSCRIILDESDNPAQKLYSLETTVKLHAGARASTSLTPNRTASITDPRDSSREGIISGCVIGASALLLITLGLVYARYEWPIKLYVKRLLIQTRKPRAGDSAYIYDCYIACCRDDEPLVYEVLGERLEKQLGYRVCLPERDFAIGAAIPHQIGEWVSQSEFFVAVVSTSFWTTEWCSLALDTALRTNARVIAVYVLRSPHEKVVQHDDMSKALSSPGCTRMTFRKFKGSREVDNLVMKLQCAMPKLALRQQNHRTDLKQQKNAVKHGIQNQACCQ